MLDSQTLPQLGRVVFEEVGRKLRFSHTPYNVLLLVSVWTCQRYSRWLDLISLSACVISPSMDHNLWPLTLLLQNISCPLKDILDPG
eukprot:g26793.t1